MCFGGFLIPLVTLYTISCPIDSAARVNLSDISPLCFLPFRSTVRNVFKSSGTYAFASVRSEGRGDHSSSLS